MKLRLTAWALALAALVFLATSLLSLRSDARSDPSTPAGLSAERAKVASIAARQIAVLNSMDPKKLDKGLAQWQDVSTGPLHDELKRTQADARKRFSAAGATAEGQVAALAVTALDPATGSATVIASVRVDLTPARGAPSQQRRRYQAAMERTPAGWKVKSLTAIAAGAG